ncbi:hypothetical protein [Caballeronia ptereochthonis]|uniref:hypothetical protein n=1 Tax=Caballeronia ptereochthonis TaxID=1777144 RepID=UPI000AC5BD7F|nr:hypothetical protein [Caballeronia ptereochthonis]
MAGAALKSRNPARSIDIPLAVKAANDRLFYIEPIALGAGSKIDWDRVHQVYGKFADVKQVDEVAHRLVVSKKAPATSNSGAQRLSRPNRRSHGLSRLRQLGRKSVRRLRTNRADGIRPEGQDR